MKEFFIGWISSVVILFIVVLVTKHIFFTSNNLDPLGYIFVISCPLSGLFWGFHTLDL